MNAVLAYLLTSAFYAALGLFFWRAAWRSGKAADEQGPIPDWAQVAVLIPLAMHGLLLYGSIFEPAGIALGVGTAISAVVWLAAIIYWAANFTYRVNSLNAVVLPIAAAAVVVQAVLPGDHVLSHTDMPAFKVHMAVSLLAYSLLTVAAVHAGLMALVERRLHGHVLAMPKLPPLLTLERLLFRILGAGFVLLTLALGSGIVFSEELFHKPLQLNHKTIFAVISWATFAALLGGRYIYGWRGRTAVRWTLSGFALLLLAYIGSKFVLEVILHR